MQQTEESDSIFVGSYLCRFETRKNDNGAVSTLLDVFIHEKIQSRTTYRLIREPSVNDQYPQNNLILRKNNWRGWFGSNPACVMSEALPVQDIRVLAGRRDPICMNKTAAGT